jgi:hypothetical protein
MSLIEINLPKSLAKALHLPVNSPKRQQIKVLKKLLKKAAQTQFGQQYHFDEILHFRSWYRFPITAVFITAGGIKPWKAKRMYAGQVRSNISR